MTERPVLFSAPMVRALLDGSKTQTRRIVKPQPVTVVRFGEAVYVPTGHTTVRKLPCPYGDPGDLLWVRETCKAEEAADGYDGIRYLADDAWEKIPNTAQAAERWVDLFHYDEKRRGRGAKVPAIHMPRWASRISLRVTYVRAERLQDISEADALAEGIGQLRPADKNDGMRHFGVPGMDIDAATAARAYRDLWNSINGPDAWAANPFVWAVSFERSA